MAQESIAKRSGTRGGIRISRITHAAILNEQSRRYGQTGIKPTVAALIDEAWRFFCSARSQKKVAA